MKEALLIDARGKACPRPLIILRKAFTENLQQKVFKIRVDNEIACENLRKFAQSQAAEVLITERKDKDFEVLITRSKQGAESTKSHEQKPRLIPKSERELSRDRKKLLLLTSNQLGQGDSELGLELMKGFIFALSQGSDLPEKIVFYNSGVKLCCKNSETVEDLKRLEKLGVQLFCCGACLEHYQLKDELEVAEISNMYDIVEMLMTAAAVIRP